MRHVKFKNQDFSYFSGNIVKQHIQHNLFMSTSIVKDR